MDLKEIQNLIKFVANSGVAEEMDDIKITIRTTIEGTATETTYVQQMPAHNQQAMPVQNAAPVAAVVDTPVVEENKYITISNHWNFYRKPTQTNLCLLRWELQWKR
jgi:acetyl-CoA carboxylase biotin carboxyl carrier protein